MLNSTFVVLFLGLISILSANACSISDTKWNNYTSKIIAVEPSNTAIKHSVAGSVKIMTGCSFFVRNMTIIPSGNAVYWYGIPKDNKTDPYPRVVAAALGSYNGQSATFTLDPQYSFDEMILLEIRSEGDNRAYGAFSLGGDLETYYKLKKGGDIDLDPTKPFSVATTITRSVYISFLTFLTVVLQIHI